MHPITEKPSAQNDSIGFVVGVVDDDPAVRKALGRLLRSGGYRPLLFASGKEFFEYQDLTGIGCLILDVRMPGMSGLDIQKCLDHYQFKMPIIFISAYDDTMVKKRAFELGAVAYLVKPFDETEINEALAKIEQILASKGVAGSNKTKILIVDDDDGMRKTLEMILTLTGYSVGTAQDGLGAIEMVRDERYDLVIMDVIMPVMNGVEAFQRIKQISPDTRVVMMTGYARDELIEEARAGGVIDVLHKPLDIPRVIDLARTGGDESDFGVRPLS